MTQQEILKLRLEYLQGLYRTGKINYNEDEDNNYER